MAVYTVELAGVAHKDVALTMNHMNHMYRIIWHEAAFRLRGACLLAVLAWGHGAGLAQAVAPPAPAPAPGQLPTGGQVVAGQAAIGQSGATMTINQGSNRAAIDWQTFNVGAAAQVKFNQPSSTSATLNRVLDANPSQIFGRISANGQVILSNPNGVHFAPGASVDVGGLTATTHSISNADFMAGKNRYSRDGATGSVVNEGKLTAALAGYIALLAPEVRNSGIIFAQMGTVALAAGEVIELQFDSNHALTKLRVTPATIKTLVENKLAVKAPGGLIILSSQAVSQVQGGVVKNSGVIEATGIKEQGGRILLEASHQVENTGTIQANAGSGDAPAGSITVTAPEIVNSGTLEAKASSSELIASPAQSTRATAHIANITLEATRSITQAEGGRIDVSAPAVAGEVHLRAPEITLSGTVDATAMPVEPSPESPAPSPGPGLIEVVATRSIRTHSAVLDASGPGGGGRISMQVTGTEGPSAPTTPQNQRPTLALLGTTLLRTSASRGKGGQVTLTGENITLLDDTRMDATGATGGGTILVGGSWQNSDTRVPQATFTTVARGVVLDASATDNGNGGTIVAWSDVHNPLSVTRAYGAFWAKGGVNGGDGGKIETSGHKLNFDGILINAKGKLGATGLWFIDPYDYTIGATEAGYVSSALNADTSVSISTANATETIDSNTVNGSSNYGDITVNSTITKTAGIGSPTLTFSAARNIIINAPITATSGKLNFVANAGPDLNTAGQFRITSSGSLSTNGGDVTAQGSNSPWVVPTVTKCVNATCRGIQIDGTISAAGGVISLTGLRSNTGVFSRGVQINAAVTTTGSGTISISGQSNNESASSKYSDGVAIDTPGLVQTGNGAITITGEAENTSKAAITGSGTIESTGNGNINFISNFGDIGASTLWVKSGGLTNITAGSSYNVTLNNAANNFTGGVRIVSGNNASITDANALVLGNTDGTSTVSGNLTANAGGAITQAGALAVTGTTSLTAGTNDITLTNTSNSFTGAVSVVSAANVNIKSATNLTLGATAITGNVTAAALAGDLTVAGNISKSSGADATATLKATGNIIQNAGTSVSSSSGKLHTILWADSDGASGGGIHVQSGASIS